MKETKIAKESRKVSRFWFYLVMFFAFVILFFAIVGVVEKAFEDNDWWAKALCYEEGAILKEVFVDKDVCIINETEYVAKFRGSGEYSNYSGYGEIKRWQLFLK